LKAKVLKAAIVSLSLGLWLIAPSSVRAQRSEQQSFGKCDHWLSSKVDVSDSPTARDMARLSNLELGKLSYRTGFSQGFALGLFGNLYGYWVGDATLDEPVAKLAPYYTRGVTQLLRRPAVLMTALDARCSDYRNRGLQLSDVGLLVIFEMGGLPTKHVDAGLGQLRLGAHHRAVLVALTADLE
jgi:hypothetical protein